MVGGTSDEAISESSGACVSVVSHDLLTPELKAATSRPLSLAHHPIQFINLRSTPSEANRFLL